MSGTKICTLFEGGHAIGGAALLNSIHVSGFRGTVVCGYRGELPPWSGQVKALDPIEVVFRRISRAEHLTYLKPWFLLREMGLDATPRRVVYLDPDIVVKCDWDFIETWMDGGVAAVEDVNGRIGHTHPLRTQWREWLDSQGMQAQCRRDVYVNAGFLGVSNEHATLLRVWEHIVELSHGHTSGISLLKNGKPNSLFYSADQDALNMALEVCPSPLSWIGPEGMDFSFGGSVLSHAVGVDKPWQRRAVKRALRGFAPSLASRSFLDYTYGPLKPFSQWERRRVVVDLRTAQAISRFWRR